jgi:hypothetical protein
MGAFSTNNNAWMVFLSQLNCLIPWLSCHSARTCKQTVLRIWIRIDPHYFEKLDPDQDPWKAGSGFASNSKTGSASDSRTGFAYGFASSKNSEVVETHIVCMAQRYWFVSFLQHFRHFRQCWHWEIVLWVSCNTAVSVALP